MRVEKRKEKMTTEQMLSLYSIPKLLFMLAVPATISQLINALYNIVDRMYISRIPTIGVQALTGVGVCFPILILISAFSQLIAGGATLASIELGKKNKEKAEKILGNGFTMLFFISICLTIFFQLTKYPVLMMFGASKNTITYAMDYMSVYLWGTVLIQMTLGLNPFIICQGKSKTAMLSILIGALLNIVLDPIFIFTLHMGVKGAAYANIIAQLVSTIWILWFLTSKKSVIRIKKENLKLEKAIVYGIAAIGISTFVMTFTECLINIAFNSGLERYGGDSYVTSMTIIQSIMQIVCIFSNGLTQGLSPIISYNYGAGHLKRVKKAYRLGFLIHLMISNMFCIFIMIKPEIFAILFTRDSNIIAIVTHYMPIFICGWGIFGIQSAVQCAFVSTGQAKLSLFLACLRKVILLIPLSFILPAFLGVLGIYLAEPISDITSALTAGILFRVHIPKILHKQEQEALFQEKQCA